MAADLQTILDRDTYATEGWKDIFDAARVDQRYVANDPWDPKDKLKRQNAGRPCISLDELAQYRNQVINDVRANPRAMKFTPKGNGATDATARFYTAHAREVEYRSKATLAYTMALQTCVESSMGWIRFYTDYETLRSPNQELRIGSVPNPLSVRADPDIQMPDASDMKFLFYDELWKVSEFNRKYPDAKVVDFGGARAKAPNWLTGTDQIKLCEAWSIETTAKKLLVITLPPMPQPDGTVRTQDPQGIFEDELDEKFPGGLPPGVVIARTLSRDVPYVYSCLTNGLEILKETPWKGKYIPFSACFGPVLYLANDEGDTKKHVMSMTRFGRDPQMAFAFLASCELELVGMTTKNPYWAYENQLDPEQMKEIQKSIHEPVAVLTAKATIPELVGQVLPLPQRNIFATDIGALVTLKEEMRRSIQASMGISPLPTDAQRINQKSGKALQRVKESGQIGSYHFVDSYDHMIQHGGVILEDLLTPTLDTARTVSVRDAQGNVTGQRINDPNDPKSVSTTGDHLVTVSTGPSFESERDAANDFMDSIVSNLQVIASIAGPAAAAAVFARSVRLKNLGAEGDSLADLIEPAQFKTKDGQPPNPELLHAQAQIQQMQQELQKLGFVIQTKQVEGQTKFAIEKYKTDADAQSEAADRELKLAIAEIAALKDKQTFLEERLRLGIEAIHEARMAGRQQAHDATQGAAQRAHDSIEAAKDRMHEHLQAERDRQHALEVGQQAVDGQLAVQAAAPQPANGAGE